MLCGHGVSLGIIHLAQCFAITGSINQFGEVQAVGGVNEKIEGFFRLCEARGLTGEQGAIIPHSNVTTLMLDERVLQAVRAGQFHIYAVRQVDEALSLLVGEDARPHPLLDRARAETRKAGGEIVVVTHAILEKISRRDNPQTVLGVFEQAYAPLESLNPASAPCWVALEQVRDPGNLGTIIRTADAAGASGVILTGQSCDPFAGDCVRATMGSIFGVPLVRLDFGTLYDKYHGETERNLREAIASTEQLAPCVLWIDEIEKGLASSGDSDGGVSRRVLGFLLTWMAERKSKVFLVATANQVHDLPPELLRKGRFDETFFVDLPGADVRVEVFAVHLARRGFDVAAFDLPVLAIEADGFSGAEIEQAIVAALYAAHAAGAPLSQPMVVESLRDTRPLSVMMREQVDALRSWARERTVPAD